MEIKRLYDSFFEFTDAVIPYKTNEEHLKDLFSYLDLCFTLITAAKGYKDDNFPERGEAGYAFGISVSSTDIGESLASHRTDLEYDSLSPAAREQIENAKFHIENRKRRAIARDFFPSFEAVCVKFGLSSLERFSLLLALSVEYDRKYEGVYTYLHNNSADFYPTKWLAVRLYRYIHGDMDGYTGIISGSSPLVRFLCDRSLKKRDRGESAERLTLSPRVCAYILGKNSIASVLAGYCRLTEPYAVEHHVPIRGESYVFVEEMFLTKAFREGAKFVLNIYGPEGIGRRYAASRAAHRVGLRVLSIDLYKLILYKYDELEKYIDMIYTETMLLGTIPCFTVDAQLTESDNEGGVRRSAVADKVKYAAEYIITVFDFVFWITPEKDNSFSDTEAQYVSIELPMLTANERKHFWQRYLKTDIDLTMFANQYILTPANLKKVAFTAMDSAKLEGTDITPEMIAKSVRQHSVNQLGTYATLINAVFTWDDLVVGDDQKRKMKMICDQVKYRSVVNEDWGFRKKSPYGRGLCALFYGSPGTGKTMAVQVMANELGIDLYRIDLSQLSSKYIGETQKNISNLFNKAKNINAMLFFDEADSMFAKRTEVKDTNDRYANADTAFLLQKLEDYEGITILATNYVNNIDDAFKRRIKFMINFVFPTPDVRLKLWRKILPAAARVDEELDLEFFAEKFELAGSNIKEILTNAAFLAAAEGRGIMNIHIMEAIKLNFSKYGKILTKDDFGYLGRSTGGNFYG